MRCQFWSRKRHRSRGVRTWSVRRVEQVLSNDALKNSLRGLPRNRPAATVVWAVEHSDSMKCWLERSLEAAHSHGTSSSS